MNEPDHLTIARAAEIIRFARGGGNPEERARIETHTTSCGEGCKERLAEELAVSAKLSEQGAGTTPARPAEREKLLRELRIGVELRIARGELEADEDAEESAGTEPAAPPAALAEVIPLTRRRLRRERVVWSGSLAAMAAALAFALIHGGTATPQHRSVSASGREPIESWLPREVPAGQVQPVLEITKEYKDDLRQRYFDAREKARTTLTKRLAEQLHDPALADTIVQQILEDPYL